MIIFQVDNLYTKVEAAHFRTGVPKELIDFCTLSYGYFIRTKKMKKAKYVTKKVCFYDKKSNRFPTGWVGSAAEFLKKIAIQVKIVDNREREEPFRINSNIPKLRDYQVKAMSNALHSTRGIIHHPTGSGKTVTAAALVAYIGQPTLYVVPNLELLNQTYDKFCEYFNDKIVAKYGGGKKTTSFITIITAQSLYRLQEKINKGFVEYSIDKPQPFEPIPNIDVNVLIIDEAHHLALTSNLMSNTWLWCAMNLNCYWRFAFTATPGKENSIQRRALEMTTGRVLHEYKPIQAIKDKHIAMPKIKFYPFDHGENMGLDWKEVQKRLFTNRIRNAMICQIAYSYFSKGKKVLITVDHVDGHGRLIKEILQDKAVFVWGGSSKKKRENVRKDFKESNKFILIGTIFGEGVDIPDLDVVIRASGGKSNRKSIQELGRVLHKTEKKTEGILIDFYDKDGGYLSKHSQQRIRAYKELGFEVEKAA